MNNYRLDGTGLNPTTFSRLIAFMRTQPLHTNFGCEISGIDLSSDLSDDKFAQLVDLYYRHSLLLFRGQSLSPGAQAKLCHRFGKPKIETRKQYNFQEHPEVSTIGNVSDENNKPLSFFARTGLGWHTDGSAACHVNAATFLYAVEVPSDGGDTLFCSTANAYDELSAELKQEFEGVSILTSFHAHNDPMYESNPQAFIPLTAQERAALPPVWHKIVQTHPVTKRRVLYLNLDPLEFDGIEQQAGRQAIAEAVAVATTPQSIYRHCWQPGELLIWDNHSMLHSGTASERYQSERRLMHRSFVYTLPTENPLPNYDQISRIFMPNEDSIRLSDFDERV